MAHSAVPSGISAGSLPAHSESALSRPAAAPAWTRIARRLLHAPRRSCGLPPLARRGLLGPRPAGSGWPAVTAMDVTRPPSRGNGSCSEGMPSLGGRAPGDGEMRIWIATARCWIQFGGGCASTRWGVMRQYFMRSGAATTGVATRTSPVRSEPGGGAGHVRQSIIFMM